MYSEKESHFGCNNGREKAAFFVFCNIFQEAANQIREVKWKISFSQKFHLVQCKPAFKMDLKPNMMNMIMMNDDQLGKIRFIFMLLCRHVFSPEVFWQSFVHERTELVKMDFATLLDVRNEHLDQLENPKRTWDWVAELPPLEAIIHWRQILFLICRLADALEDVICTRMQAKNQEN